MCNLKSTLLVLLLGIILVVPAVYCFTLISPSLEGKDEVDEGKNDSPQTAIIDVVPPITMNDTTKDTSINNDDTTKDSSIDDATSEDSSIDDDDTAEDSSIDNDDTSEDSSMDDKDTAKDTSTSDPVPSSNGADTNSWPVIMIVEDNSALVNAKSESDLRRVDSNNNWLILNKKTSIRKVEEHTRDFGKNRKVLSEDRTEELRIYRDNLHTVIRNGIDLTNYLRL